MIPCAFDRYRYAPNDSVLRSLLDELAERSVAHGRATGAPWVAIPGDDGSSKGRGNKGTNGSNHSVADVVRDIDEDEGGEVRLSVGGRGGAVRAEDGSTPDSEEEEQGSHYNGSHRAVKQRSGGERSRSSRREDGSSNSGHSGRQSGHPSGKGGKQAERDEGPMARGRATGRRGMKGRVIESGADLSLGGGGVEGDRSCTSNGRGAARVRRPGGEGRGAAAPLVSEERAEREGGRGHRNDDEWSEDDGSDDDGWHRMEGTHGMHGAGKRYPASESVPAIGSSTERGSVLSVKPFKGNEGLQALLQRGVKEAEGGSVSEDMDASEETVECAGRRSVGSVTPTAAFAAGQLSGGEASVQAGLELLPAVLPAGQRDRQASSDLEGGDMAIAEDDVEGMTSVTEGSSGLKRATAAATRAIERHNLFLVDLHGLSRVSVTTGGLNG